MLCFILSGALCYVHGEDRTENEKGEGIPIEVKELYFCILKINGKIENNNKILIL